MIVIDTSVFTDFLLKFDIARHKNAKLLLEAISNENMTIYEPFLFEIELASILSRKHNSSEVTRIIQVIREKINIIEENSLHRISFDIGLNTGCRAVDAYFVAVAKFTDSILMTNDKIMSENSKKCGIESYYLLKEFDKAIERINKIS